jgi:hypothetical protein
MSVANLLGWVRRHLYQEGNRVAPSLTPDQATSRPHEKSEAPCSPHDPNHAESRPDKIEANIVEPHPDPARLSKLADHHDAAHLRDANAAYQRFLATEYPSFIARISESIENAASQGSRGIVLHFDHWTGEVDLDPQIRYTLPLPTKVVREPGAPAEGSSLIDRAAAETAEYFRKLGFDVSVNRFGYDRSQRGRRSNSPFTSLIILWRVPSEDETSLQETADTSLPNLDVTIVDVTSARPAEVRAPSYQTAPLEEYHSTWRVFAREIFASVQACVGRSRARAYKGSFSVLSRDNSYTAAKIIIYHTGLGKANGDWPPLSDGVYVLLRADRGPKELQAGASTLFDPCLTLGIAPKHQERFYYFRVPDSGLDDAARVILSWVD